MQKVLFVSVNQSFDPAMSNADLEPWVERAWAISVRKAESVDRVVAVMAGEPLCAWRVLGAFATAETYLVSPGDTRQRVGLSLGETLPVLRAYRDVPALRHGVAVREIDCPPLPEVR